MITRDEARESIAKIFNLNVETAGALETVKEIGFEGKEGLILLSTYQLIIMKIKKDCDKNQDKQLQADCRLIYETGVELVQEKGFDVSEEFFKKSLLLASTLFLDEAGLEEFARLNDSVKQKNTLVGIEQTQKRFEELLDFYLNTVFTDEIANNQLDVNTIIIVAGTSRLVEVCQDEFNEATLTELLTNEVSNLQHIIQESYGLDFMRSKGTICKLLNEKVKHIQFEVINGELAYHFVEQKQELDLSKSLQSILNKF